MYKIIGGDQQEYGPATEQEIRQWITEGRLSADSLVQMEGSGEWRRLATFPEFHEALQKQPGSTWKPSETPPRLPSVAQDYAAVPRELDIGASLAGGWHLLRGNFSLFFAATLLIWMVELISQFVPLLLIVFWSLHGVLYGGLFLVVLKRVRDQSSSVGEVFRGFGPAFAQLALAGMVTSILTRIGLLFCLLPWLYLTVAWAFTLPLVMDKQLGFWQAMEESRRAVNRVWFQVFRLMVVAFLPVILMNVLTELVIFSVMLEQMREMFGTVQPNLNQLFEKMPQLLEATAHKTVPWVLASKAVLLLNLPFAVSSLMHAYEQLFGPKASPGA